MTGHMSEQEQKQKKYYDAISAEYDQHYASSNALRYRHELYTRFLQGLKFQDLQVLNAMCEGKIYGVF
jgi:hypothetical protein